MLWFRNRIVELEFRLSLEARTAQERCDVRLNLAQEMTRAVEDRQSVIVAAHEANEAALGRQLEAERAEVRRVTRSQHAWFRSPVLWFSVGVISAGSLAIALR